MRLSARPSLEGGRTHGRLKSREKRCALLARNSQTSLLIVGRFGKCFTSIFFVGAMSSYKYSVLERCIRKSKVFQLTARDSN